MRRLVFIIIPALVLAIGWGVWPASQPASTGTTNNDQSEQTTKSSAPPTHIRLFATGDFIAHDSVNQAAQKQDGSYDYVQLMPDFKPLFAKADIRFCNDPILNGGKALGISGYPAFNSPTEFVDDMSRLGCNLVNTASNHSFDFTQAHINASVDAWAKQPNVLAVVGQNRNQTEHDRVYTFTVKGVKMAFLAYTSYSNKPPANSYGLNVFTNDFASKQISQAKAAGAEFIIVSMRWGTEYSPEVNAAQKKQAQFLADQGVQLVLGHGPHVVQPVQELKGTNGNKTLVWYSLGNFLNSQIPAETQINGVAVMDIALDSKQISASKYLPIYMHYEWSAEEARAERLLSRRNLRLMLLEKATDEQLKQHQLQTTISSQKERLSKTLSGFGLTIPLTAASEL